MNAENQSLLSLDTIKGAGSSADSMRDIYGSSPASKEPSPVNNEDVPRPPKQAAETGGVIINRNSSGNGEDDSFYDDQQQQQQQQNGGGGEGEEDDDIPDAPLEHHLRTNELYRSALIVTFPVFSAYATCITMQRGLKNKLGITNESQSKSDLFGVAVGSVYLGNLLLRLGHNIIFSFLKPRQRVQLAFCLVLIANLILGSHWIPGLESTDLTRVFIAYLLSGVAIGSFEGNVMSSLAPLGHETKSWAVLGLPSGFQAVAIGFFVIYAIWPNEPWLHGLPYFIVAGLNVIGFLWFTFVIPKFDDFAAANDNFAKFREDLKLWRDFLPRIKWQCLSLGLDMFNVSMFSSIVYYIYDADKIPLWPYSATSIGDNPFQIIFNSLGFLGDMGGRRLIYFFPSVRKIKNPLIFVATLGIFGAGCILSKTALIAPIGFLAVMLCNGLCYANGTRHIDATVDDRFILVALSVWLFVGDIGSYSASLIVQPLQIWIGKVPFHNDTAPAGNMTNSSNLTSMFL